LRLAHSCSRASQHARASSQRAIQGNRIVPLISSNPTTRCWSSVCRNFFYPSSSAKATPAELRGQQVFFGKGQCASCHQPPYYTDNSMHDLQTERFFKPVKINNMMAIGDGPVKTFPLRGIKDNPPYLHDERLLTLDDTVEFFNLVLGTKLSHQEKQDLVAFLRTL
jgi:cytochrome c peroxidase